MLREEIEQAIYDEIGTASYDQTRSRGLGEEGLRDLNRRLDVWGSTFHYYTRKRYNREKIANIMGWEMETHELRSPFSKAKLKQILHALNNPPDRTSWEVILQWPHNLNTQEA